MIFHKGDILQICRNSDESTSFVFTVVKKDIDHRIRAITSYLNDEMIFTRDAHRYNLVSGKKYTTMLVISRMYEDEYINRPYSDQIIWED